MVTSRLHHDSAHIQPKPMSLPSSTAYTLQFMKYSLDKSLKVKDTTARSKVKSRLYYHVAHLHPQPLTNVLTKYQHPKPKFLRYSLEKIFSATHPPVQPDAIGETNTHTAFETCYHCNSNSVYNFYICIQTSKKTNLHSPFRSIQC